MNGISKEELINYINSRISIAHGNFGIFNDQALEAIYSACNGSIRIANNLLTKSLIIGKIKEKSIIDSDIVLEASNELALG